jgi:hypothetical protein
MGLDTGFVVVGAVGDNLRMDYTAVGDTTRLAARLQQLAGPDEILISDATARLVEGHTSRTRGPVEIRGRTGPVTVHEVLGPGSRRSPLDDTDGRTLIGMNEGLRIVRSVMPDVDPADPRARMILALPSFWKDRRG